MLRVKRWPAENSRIQPFNGLDSPNGSKLQLPTSTERNVLHVLVDGADSVGTYGALNRVYVNIGAFHEEWIVASSVS